MSTVMQFVISLNILYTILKVLLLGGKNVKLSDFTLGRPDNFIAKSLR